MSEQEKKQQRIYDLVNAESKPKILCRPNTKQRKDCKKKKKKKKKKKRENE